MEFQSTMRFHMKRTGVYYYFIILALKQFGRRHFCSLANNCQKNRPNHQEYISCLFLSLSHSWRYHKFRRCLFCSGSCFISFWKNNNWFSRQWPLPWGPLMIPGRMLREATRGRAVTRTRLLTWTTCTWTTWRTRATWTATSCPTWGTFAGSSPTWGWTGSATCRSCPCHREILHSDRRGQSGKSHTSRIFSSSTWPTVFGFSSEFHLS